MYGYIYKITNLLNNKIYIGKHKYSRPELDKNYITSGVIIKQSIKKYGIENFNIEIIKICNTLQELNTSEIYYIKEYNSRFPIGYNLTDGGDGISEPSAEIREINRLKHLGVKQSEESNIKRSNTLKGRKHSPEWINKIAIANKGQHVSEQQKEISRKRHLGTHWYNDGVKEYLLFDYENHEGLKLGRLHNCFPNQTGLSKSKSLIEKMRKSKSGSTWFNNGEIELMLHDLNNVPNGFVKGRLKRKNK